MSDLRERAIARVEESLTLWGFPRTRRPGVESVDVAEVVDLVLAESPAEVERLRGALHRIERLKDRWSAPLTHPVGDMRDPAYAGAAAWAAVGSEAHKIATDALRESRATEDRHDPHRPRAARARLPRDVPHVAGGSLTTRSQARRRKGATRMVGSRKSATDRTTPRRGFTEDAWETWTTWGGEAGVEFVYFICEGWAPGAIKIGRATDPEKRLLTLQTGNPRPLCIEQLVLGGLREERLLHNFWADAHINGEWFGGGMRTAILNVGAEIAGRQYRAEAAGETRYAELHHLVLEVLRGLRCGTQEAA